VTVADTRPETCLTCLTPSTTGTPSKQGTPRDQVQITYGTRLINQDVPQEVVRRILDHESPEMTAHYARLHDTTVRRHWERARKVNVQGEAVNLDSDGSLADAAWAKQRLSRATQALPNGYCGLPPQRACPHANAPLTALTSMFGQVKLGSCSGAATLSGEVRLTL